MMKTLDDLGNVSGQRALVRLDLNVPMHAGLVSDEARLVAAKATVRELADKGATVLLLSHFDRPKGRVVPEMSLAPLCAPLAAVLERDVQFVPDCRALQGQTYAPGTILLLENTRFHPGEEANDPAFAAELASLGDFYVNDAFSCAHRAHVSTAGLAMVLPGYAGRAMQAELAALTRVLEAPERPLVAVVGGAKVSTKLSVLEHLVDRVEHLIIGGGMANTFLAARGVAVGGSLQEAGLYSTALKVLEKAEASGCTVHLPYEVVVARQFAPNAPNRVANIHDIADDEMILDIGPASVEALCDVVKTCRTLVWNGPLGAFETPPFEAGTLALARTVAALTADGSLVSVGGGGDTVAALAMADVLTRFSYVSTAGGAFLEWMEGRVLPGVAALNR